MIRVLGAAGAVLFASTFVSVLAYSGDAIAQTASKLDCKGCVRGKQLGNNAVTKKKIKSNSVTADKLGKDAKPVGVDFASGGTGLTTTDAIVTSVEITPPSKGYIVAIFSGYANFAGDPASFVRCGLTTGTTVPDESVFANGEGIASSQRSTMSQTRVFGVVTEATVINLVCVASVDGPSILSVDQTAFFIPNLY